uniref:Small ribosomal subunit protein uS9c n=1 Tax=Bracteacoccus aerius TaxID=50041 RepID=A0A140HAQ5_9CHLO|nr:ribosomal protein S9 [Bracteacoccus aerius]AMO01254.1 ribosomal protein S9 [Bracteacoccus aerius]
MTSSKQKVEIIARAVGRRKEAVAQVLLTPGNGEFIINNKPAQIYLHNNSCSILSIKAPFEVLQNLEDQTFNINQINTIVKVQGGGLVGQAEAIKLAIARAVCQMNTSDELSTRKSLKDKGYLTQDSRVKERRKYGLKKARKASQYHKR